MIAFAVCVHLSAAVKCVFGLRCDCVSVEKEGSCEMNASLLMSFNNAASCDAAGLLAISKHNPESQNRPTCPPRLLVLDEN